MDRPERKAPRLGWAVTSVLLALCLHAGPAWYLFFGHLYGLPSVLELNIDAINWYRQRIFRERPPDGSVQSSAVPPLNITVSMQARPDTGKRVSGPRSESELVRARAVQRAIKILWESMSPERPGYALVSLNIREDGSIGEFVLNRISGGEEFQAFLLSFLSTLKATTGSLGGAGEPLWIECEFVIQPVRGKGAS
ncbi:hypothetical protein DSECCO2_354720 [anaerobic digester metagenome]